MRGTNEAVVKDLIIDRVRKAYREKEITFPVEVAMASHMAEHDAAGLAPASKNTIVKDCIDGLVPGSRSTRSSCKKRTFALNRGAAVEGDPA